MPNRRWWEDNQQQLQAHHGSRMLDRPFPLPLAIPIEVRSQPTAAGTAPTAVGRPSPQAPTSTPPSHTTAAQTSGAAAWLVARGQLHCGQAPSELYK